MGIRDAGRRSAPRVLGCRALLVWALLLLGAHAHGAKVALLIGVGEYPKLGPASQLQGPPNDVAELAGVLTRRWGFRAQDVKTLVNAQGTRQAILDALRELEQRSRSGDEVLIYFSGHGTSAADAANEFPLPHSSGGFMPYDLDPRLPNPERQLVVGRYDLLPILKRLEDGGRRVLVIIDSCFSQNAVRSGGRTLPSRMVPVLRDVPGDLLKKSLERAHTKRADPYPYKATATLAASAEGEVARDITDSFLPVHPTRSGKPHGAFTDALLRVLEGDLPADANRDGYLDLVEVHAAVSRFMATRAYGQSPQRLPSVIDDNFGLGSRAAFSGTGAASRPPALAESRALRVYADADEIAAPLIEAVRRVPGVELARRSADAHLRLRLRSSNPRVADAPREVALLTAAEDTITTLSPQDERRLEQQLRQIAWVGRLQSLALEYRRGQLSWGFEPDQRGSNFYVGDRIRFLVRPDRQGWLVLINVNAESGITVLYPHLPSELRALPAGLAKTIPESSQIAVVEPLGMDMQIALMFDERPAGLDSLLALGPHPPSHPGWEALGRMLEANRGRFTSASSELRVYPATRPVATE